MKEMLSKRRGKRGWLSSAKMSCSFTESWELSKKRGDALLKRRIAARIVSSADSFLRSYIACTHGRINTY